MLIRVATEADVDAWLSLRTRLWPATPVAQHRSELAQQLASPARFVALLALDDSGRAVGFAEAARRNDFVNGCATSPAAFLEGIFVEPKAQRRGTARALCAAVERWAVANGCTELASDALIGNAASDDFHRSIGFTPTERVIFYRKELS
jgi:aminoglycoside 6'-N-acetyltransferase I